MESDAMDGETTSVMTGVMAGGLVAGTTGGTINAVTMDAVTMDAVAKDATAEAQAKTGPDAGTPTRAGAMTAPALAAEARSAARPPPRPARWLSCGIRGRGTWCMASVPCWLPFAAAGGHCTACTSSKVHVSCLHATFIASHDVWFARVVAGLTPTDRKDKQALQVATAAAEAQGIPVQHVPKHDLNILTNQRPHQVGMW